jgi:hypothetical protein
VAEAYRNTEISRLKEVVEVAIVKAAVAKQSAVQMGADPQTAAIEAVNAFAKTLDGEPLSQKRSKMQSLTDFAHQFPVNPDLAESSDILELDDRKMVDRKGKDSQDAVALRAIEYGFLPEGSTGREYIEALHNEQAGRMTRSSEDEFQMPERPMESMSQETLDREIDRYQEMLGQGKAGKSVQQRLADLLDMRKRRAQTQTEDADFAEFSKSLDEVIKEPDGPTPGQLQGDAELARLAKANQVEDDLIVSLVDRIDRDDEAFKEGYGREFDESQDEIKGVTKHTTGGQLRAIIELASGATRKTARHEFMHFARANLLDQKQSAVLDDAFQGNKEDEADAFGLFMEEGSAGNSLVDKVFKQVKQFIDRMANWMKGKGFQTWQDVFKAIDSGKLGKQKSRVLTPDDVQFSVEQRDITAAYEKSVDDIFTQKRQLTYPIPVLKNSDILTKIGAREAPLVIAQKNVVKAREKHEMDVDAIKKLPGEIYKPVMVFKSATEDNSFVFLTELKNRKGVPVAAAVHLDQRMGRMVVHDIASVGKRELSEIGEWLKRGLLRYRDPQKATAWLQSTGLYANREGDAPSKSKDQSLQIRSPLEGTSPSDTNIADTTKSVKPQFSVEQTRTPAFRQWFGNSKVVDAQGKPLVVYHGTAESGLKGDAFNKDLLGSVTKSRSAKAGFFFVADKETARGYSRVANEKPVADLIARSEAAERAGRWDLAHDLIAQAEKLEQESNPKENVIEAYLSIKNPFQFDAKGERFLDIQDAIHEAIKTAKSGDHDGIVLHNLIDNADWGSSRETDHWIAFESTQIKSANSNRGTFDPKDPRIQYSVERKDEGQVGQSIKAISDSIKAKEVGGDYTLGDGETITAEDLADSLTVKEIIREKVSGILKAVKQGIHYLELPQNYLYAHEDSKPVAEGVIDAFVARERREHDIKEFKRVALSAPNKEALAEIIVAADRDNDVNIFAELTKAVKAGKITAKDKDAFTKGLYFIHKAAKDQLIRDILASRVGVRIKSMGNRYFVAYETKDGKAQERWLTQTQMRALEKRGTKVTVLEEKEQIKVKRGDPNKGEIIESTRKVSSYDEALDMLKEEEKQLIREILPYKNYIPHARRGGKFWVEAYDAEQKVYSARVPNEVVAKRMSDLIAKEHPDWRVDVHPHGEKMRVMPSFGSMADVQFFMNQNGIDPTSEPAQRIMNAYRSMSPLMSSLIHSQNIAGYKVDWNSIVDSMALMATSGSGRAYRLDVKDLLDDVKNIKDDFRFNTAVKYVNALAEVQDDHSTVLQSIKSLTYFWLLANKSTYVIQNLTEPIWALARIESVKNPAIFALPLNQDFRALLARATEEGILRPFFSEQALAMNPMETLQKLDILGRASEVWSSRKVFDIGLRLARDKGLRGDEAYRYAYQFLFNKGKPFYSTANKPIGMLGKGWAVNRQYGFMLLNFMFDWIGKFARGMLRNKLMTLMAWVLLGGFGTLPFGRKLMELFKFQFEKNARNYDLLDRFMLGGIAGMMGISPSFIVPTVLKGIPMPSVNPFRSIDILGQQIAWAAKSYEKYGIMGAAGYLPLAGGQYLFRGQSRLQDGFKADRKTIYRPKSTYEKTLVGAGLNPFEVNEYYRRKED